MAEKILQTRILNKIDTLENWGKSSLKIKQGEICLATVAASAGTGLTEPVVMMKIGTAEEKTFAELPWSFYAKASDVLAACKTEDGLKAFVNGVIADAGIASSEAMETLAGRVTKTETDIATLNGNAETAGSVAKSIADAIAALKLSETYDAKGAAAQALVDANAYTDGKDSAMNTRVSALEASSETHALKTEVEAVDSKFANYKTAEAQKAIDDEQDRRIKVIEDDYVVAADIADFETKANVKQVADDLAAYVQSNNTALAGVKATAEAARTEDEVNSQIDTKITGLNLATTYEPIGAETRAKSYADGLISDANLAQYTTEQEVKDIVDGVIAGAVDGDAITGLANLVEYLNTHGGEAAEMGAAIDVLEGKVEVIEGKPAYGITATQISNWDNEVGAKALAETKLDAATFNAYNEAHANDYTNKQIDDAIDADVKAAIDAEVLRANGAYDDKGAAAAAQSAAETTAAGALSAAKTELEGKISDAQTAAEGHADGLNTAMDARMQAVEGKSHEHANKELLDTYTQTEANLADAVAKKHDHANKSELDLIASGDKAKWDAKVETVTAAADSGLKATRTDNNIAIEIDENIIFVFDCGNSGVTA